jgi:hypothetical protein
MAILTTLNGAAPIDASDDSYHTFPTDAGSVLSQSFGTLDADFSTMDSLTITLEASLVNALGDDSYTLRLSVFNVANDTVMAADTSADNGFSGALDPTLLGEDIVSTTDSSFGPITFAYVNTTATKAEWEASEVRITQIHTQTKGGDGNAIRVDHVIFDGVYTQAVNQSINAIGLNPSFTVGSTGITPGAVSLASTGLNPSITVGVADITPGTASITSTGLNPAFVIGTTSINVRQNILSTGLNPSITIGTASINVRQAIASIGLNPSITVGTADITPGTASIASTGLNPSITVGTASTTPGIASIPSTGLNPSITVGTTGITPGISGLASTGLNPSIIVGTASIVRGDAYFGIKGNIVLTGNISFSI